MGELRKEEQRERSIHSRLPSGLGGGGRTDL